MRLKQAIVRVLKRARYARGWTLLEVAERSGLSEWTVSRVFRGRTWSITSVQRIAEALEVEVGMVGGLEDVDTEPEAPVSRKVTT